MRRPTRIAASAMTTASSIQPHVLELDVLLVGAVVVVVELEVVVVGRSRVVVVAGSVVVVVGAVVGGTVVVVGATEVVVTGAVVVVVSAAAAGTARAPRRMGVAERARRSATEWRQAFECMRAAYGERPTRSGDHASGYAIRRRSCD
jgi:hypothetical protein